MWRRQQSLDEIHHKIQDVVQVVSVGKLLIPTKFLARAVSVNAEVQDVDSPLVFSILSSWPREIEQKVQHLGERVLRFHADVLGVRVAEESDVLSMLQRVRVEAPVLP